jgi:hypothetical protein
VIPKFVQIATSSVVHPETTECVSWVEHRLFALDDSGAVWELCDDESGWMPMPKHPGVPG